MLDDVRELFARHGLIDLFDWFEDVMPVGGEIQLVRGNYAGPVPPILVVDGNLHGEALQLTGVLVVLGNVAARDVLASGAVFVKGDLVVSGECACTPTVDLYCQTLRAKALVGEDLDGVHAVARELHSAE